MTTVNLRPRLYGLFEKARIALPRDAGFHDIACDHGNLAAALVQVRPDLRVEASDLLPTAISRAKALHGNLPISFFVSDGLAGHHFASGDGLVIAGVGGHTLIDILEDAKNWRGESKPELTAWLQTSQQVEILRESLYGFSDRSVEDEFIVEDRGKLYVNFQVRFQLPLKPTPRAEEPNYRHYGGGPKLIESWKQQASSELWEYFSERLQFARMKVEKIRDPLERVTWQSHEARMLDILKIHKR